jgi:hypothetical protein
MNKKVEERIEGARRYQAVPVPLPIPVPIPVIARERERESSTALKPAISPS